MEKEGESIVTRNVLREIRECEPASHYSFWSRLSGITSERIRTSYFQTQATLSTPTGQATGEMCRPRHTRHRTDVIRTQQKNTKRVFNVINGS